MKIIALDGASGTGKSILIKRLKTYFESIGRDEVRVERLLSVDLEKDLDGLKNAGFNEMRPTFCDKLISAYRDGYDKLREQDVSFQRRNSGELIYILDRYLLSLYAIQGIEWGICNLYEKCRDIPLPDGQFIIRLTGIIRQEDMLFLTAANEWRDYDFHGEIWEIQNKLSYTEDYDSTGYNAVRDAIIRFLNNRLEGC